MADKNNFIISLEDSTVNVEISGGVSVFDVNIETSPEFNIEMTPGARGYSAYDVAVQNGFIGTEEEWLASLQGPPGDTSDYEKRWIDYATGYSIIPVQILDDIEYVVYEYHYEILPTLYRKISKINLDDAFYSDITLTDLVVKKKL